MTAVISETAGKPFAHREYLKICFAWILFHLSSCSVKWRKSDQSPSCVAEKPSNGINCIKLWASVEGNGYFFYFHVNITGVLQGSVLVLSLFFLYINNFVLVHFHNHSIILMAYDCILCVSNKRQECHGKADSDWRDWHWCPTQNIPSNQYTFKFIKKGPTVSEKNIRTMTLISHASMLCCR